MKFKYKMVNNKLVSFACLSCGGLLKTKKLKKKKQRLSRRINRK